METVTVTVQPGELPHRQVLTIFSGLLAGLFLAAMDQTIVATALPTIVGELGDLRALSWVVAGYLITSTATTPLYGKFGDLYGRRIVFQFAIIVFIAGSLACGAAQSMLQLVLARAVQGVGGGGLMALAFTIVGDILAPRQRGRYMGYFGAVFALAGVTGPVVGGFFTDHVSWRWIFWINLPIGLVAMAIVMANLRLPLPTATRRIDYLGGVLLVAAVTCVMLVSVWGGNQYAWTSREIIGLGVTAAVLTFLFLLQERTAPEPMLPLRLFANPVVAVATGIGFAISAALFVATIFLPLFLQAVVGVSATNSGLAIAPTMAGVTISSVTAGRRITATGHYRRYLIAGCGLAAVMMATLTQLDENTTAVAIGVAMFAIGLGLGMVFPILNLASQNAVPYAEIGTATSTVRFAQSLGGTLAVAGAGALLAVRLEAGLANVAGVDPARVADSPRQIQALPVAVRGEVVAALADAVGAVFVAALPVIVVAFLLSFLMPELPLRETTASTPSQ